MRQARRQHRRQAQLCAQAYPGLFIYACLRIKHLARGRIHLGTFSCTIRIKHLARGSGRIHVGTPSCTTTTRGHSTQRGQQSETMRYAARAVLLQVLFADTQRMNELACIPAGGNDERQGLSTATDQELRSLASQSAQQGSEPALEAQGPHHLTAVAASTPASDNEQRKHRPRHDADGESCPESACFWPGRTAPPAATCIHPCCRRRPIESLGRWAS